MPLSLSDKSLSDLMVTAFEGGSNYWVERAEYIPPKGMTLAQLDKLAWKHAPEKEKELWKTPKGVPLYSLISYLPPDVKWKIRFIPNEVVKKEGERFYLTREKMTGALQALTDKYGHIVGRILQEEYDAGDADAWLQMGALGDVIFG